jgi:hypothetical protein
VANTKESRTFIIKLINDYLPVGKRVRLYKPYYEAQCPSCDAPEEDREHVFHCPAADRELWQTEFLKKLAKKCSNLSTAPALKSVLVTGLECILYDTTVVVNEPPHLHALCVLNKILLDGINYSSADSPRSG